MCGSVFIPRVYVHGGCVVVTHPCFHHMHEERRHVQQLTGPEPHVRDWGCSCHVRSLIARQTCELLRRGLQLSVVWVEP